MRLEEGDSAVQDVTKIDVQTAGSAGAATIWGMEILAIVNAITASSGFHDSLVGGLHLQDLKPAAATSGSLTSYLVNFTLSSNSLSPLTVLWGASNA